MWWRSPSLVPTADGLTLDGVRLDALAREVGTPLFVYSEPTIRRNVAALRGALDAAGVRSQIFYATKANRSAPVLGVIRSLGDVGLDTCSPREVALALASGFTPEEVSFNAGMLSDRDLASVAATGVRVILDSLSALRRYGACDPVRRTVGLRFDPGVSAGYQARTHLAYGQAKFGFEHEALGDALAAAARAGLVVDNLHVHLGWGLGEDAAAEVDAAFGRLAALARRTPGLVEVNVGGGLGARYRAEDRPLALELWSDAIRRHLAPLGLRVACEPGTAIVGAAGVLLVEVNTVERRRGTTWVGVDAGHAVNPCAALYGIPIAVVDAARPLAASDGQYAVVGNINEAGDVWAADVALPGPGEGTILALLPAGAYATSMASDHCLRGRFSERLVGGASEVG